jgi:alkylation response protein AidB-like acyl-CoA dehydrogenase
LTARSTQAAELAGLALACADETERERALPARLVEQLRACAFFHLLVPRAYGGAELPLPEYVPLVEALATGDSSTAWCVNQAAVYATLACRADPVTAQEIWGDPRTSVSNGPIVPARIAPVDGGHRISGRWDFSSGCRHANWVGAATTVDGTQQVSMLPIDDVQLLDTWQVQGLRGTGSFSFVAEDVFVPARRVIRFGGPPRIEGALYGIPTNLLFASGFAATALGNARAMLDATFALLGTKTPVFEREPVRLRASVQQDVACAEATVQAARAFLLQAVDALWHGAVMLGRPSIDARTSLRLAATHAIQQSAEAVQLAYRTCGSSAIFAASPLQRRFQDAHVISQQVQGRLSHYEVVGQQLLGMDPRPDWF